MGSGGFERTMTDLSKRRRPAITTGHFPTLVGTPGRPRAAALLRRHALGATIWNYSAICTISPSRRNGSRPRPAAPLISTPPHQVGANLPGRFRHADIILRTRRVLDGGAHRPGGERREVRAEAGRLGQRRAAVGAIPQDQPAGARAGAT